jgi:cbb3-type cytochrome oxidase maturation protein
MMDITFYQFFIALLVSLAGWCIFLWAIRTGQFRDVEDIKYQVWPALGDPSGDDGGEAAGAVSGVPKPTDGR